MNTSVNKPNQCPSCGKPLPVVALPGLCPSCLLAQGVDTERGDGAGGRLFEAPPLAEVAKLFPQLEILSLLGSGGMGAVYKARQPALDRMVALKVMPSAAAGAGNFAERFNREARALARLSHPNIVGVHEFGQAGGLHFFIMEFVDGANLRQLEKTARLSPREALQIIPQICDALQYAHDEGVVHRDIKPENVLVDRKGRVKIADFGLAKILGLDPESLRLTDEGQVMGTPHYMAPEQIERPLTVDHRADIYSLGVVFYEMLTGDLPLGKFSPPSTHTGGIRVDVRLDEVVLRALENDPSCRYQRASEVKSEVETIAGTPAPDRRTIRWLGFPLVIERDGDRRVNWKETFAMLVMAFGMVTLLFILARLFVGRPAFPLSGVVIGRMLVACLSVALLAVACGVGRTLNRPWDEPLSRAAQRTAIHSPKRNRKHLALFGGIGFLLACAVIHTLWRKTLYDASHGVPRVEGPVAEAVARLGASTEMWAPSLAPGEKPDPNKVRDESREMMERGEYEQALQRQIWYHNHAAEIQPSLSAVRLSFGLADWLELSRRYPRARQALIETRDIKTSELDAGRGHSNLFADVASINFYLQEEGATVALLKRIQKADPPLAAQCIHYAREALRKNGG